MVRGNGQYKQSKAWTCSEAHVQARTCDCFLGCSLFCFYIIMIDIARGATWEKLRPGRQRVDNLTDQCVFEMCKKQKQLRDYLTKKQ